MTQMQRSLSLPGHVPASPPIPSTREPGSPTVARRRFSRAQWLVGPDATNAPHFEPSNSFAERKQLAHSAASNAAGNVKPDGSVGTVLEQNKSTHPSLQDVSQYTDGQLKAAAVEAASTTLEELAHLARLSTYQKRKRFHARTRLQGLLVSTALSARLARCGELAHRTLVDNFRAEDKKTFAQLYNAIHDVRNSCEATKRFALLEPDLNIARPTLAATDRSGPHSTFMHDLPSRTRETFLQLLIKIRTDPDFLASRIASLTSGELSALTSFHQGLEPIDSVLPFHNRSRGHNSNRNSTFGPSPVERLLSFQRHDPLSALIHTCFANSAGPDSAEDLRRTNIWATVCARLITDGKSGAESFICHVLNIWSSMRDWSGRSNLEWYLMRILEDGAFLLEKAEDQAGTRIHVEPRNAKDSIAAEEFYERAVKDLFELVDDPGAGGIPDGLFELGHAIIRKVDPKRHVATRLLVTKWLFSVFLVNAVVHPESYGMMTEYHITEYGRQKILKEVAMRVNRLVVDFTWKQSPATPPDIRAHIENINSRFRSAKKTAPKLLPARSITSLRETAEVHPYLVLSPSDLVTLINSLYPVRRPGSSSIERDTYGLRSSAPSISSMSVLSMPTDAPPPSRGFDTASILSTSASSVFSDATSREPLLDDGSIDNQFSSTSISSMSQTIKMEDDAYQLRLAIREMSHALGAEATSGSCHPCAEHWAVIYIGNDGQDLSCQMMHDEEEEDSSCNEDDLATSGTRPDLDGDYPQLRGSILQLVEDYEIPQSFSAVNELKTFSNKTSMEGLSKKRCARSRAGANTAGQDSRSLYRPQASMTLNKSPSERPLSNTTENESDDPENTEERRPLLLEMLEAAESQCKAESDFVGAHKYWSTAKQLQHLASQSLKGNGFESLLNIFSRGPRELIRRSASALEEYDAWLVWLRQSQERHDIIVEAMMTRIRALRDKMWYVTDVRNSAAYEGARSVAVALKTMGTPKNSKYAVGLSGRSRNASRSTPLNFLLRTEAQVLDIISTPEQQGGPNKLSDDQSEKVSNWLSDCGVENFCKGEERIHRFCLEIETCVNKLLGDNLMDGPVLWSSELYLRDKSALDNNRQRGDMVLPGLGTLSISSENSPDPELGRRSLRGLGVSSSGAAGARDLRSIFAGNGSQQSFESSRWSVSWGSGADVVDSRDYFGTSSPVMSIDSSITFWSPFHARRQSPANYADRSRPPTASTSHEISSDEDSIRPRQRFLDDLKQTLTSLLISDLGTLVFARGSETDAWFSGDMGQDCMERRQEKEPRERQAKMKPKVIEKKRSFQDLRAAKQADQSTPDLSDALEEERGKGAAPLERSNISTRMPHAPSSIDVSSDSNEAHSGTSREWKALKDDKRSDFPYKPAYQRLLKMFSVHPNPYIKLNALYELECLILASFTSARCRRSSPSATLPPPQPTRHPGEPGPEVPMISNMRSSKLDQAIDSVRERRPHTLVRGDQDFSPRKALHNSKRSTAASSDMIVEVLQNLFREANMRPKTLFRDLQFIAAFVPSSILDKAEKGNAFCNAGVAALGLKEDVCKTMIDVANDIVVYYTQTRKASTMNQIDATEPHMKYTMADAARIWTITAKEGFPVAERELAIFYLTHPELVERTTFPFSKPKEIFKAQVMEMHGGGPSGGKDGDRERSDPATMCVAYHWLELAAQGGDEVAKENLRQREELNALP